VIASPNPFALVTAWVKHKPLRRCVPVLGCRREHGTADGRGKETQGQGRTAGASMTKPLTLRFENVTYHRNLKCDLRRDDQTGMSSLLFYIDADNEFLSGETGDLHIYPDGSISGTICATGVPSQRMIDACESKKAYTRLDGALHRAKDLNKAGRFALFAQFPETLEHGHSVLIACPGKGFPLSGTVKSQELDGGLRVEIVATANEVVFKFVNGKFVDSESGCWLEL
jgi:hypothetical protein